MNFSRILGILLLGMSMTSARPQKKDEEMPMPVSCKIEIIVNALIIVAFFCQCFHMSDRIFIRIIYSTTLNGR